MENYDFDYRTLEIAALCRKFDARLAIFTSVVGDDFHPGTMTLADYLSTDASGDQTENEDGA